MKPNGKLISLVAGMAMILLAGLSISFFAGNKVILLQSEIRLHSMILQHLEVMFSILKDAETAQRGYLLTDQESYLDPYLQARNTIPGQLIAFREYAKKGLLPLAEVTRLSDLASAKMEELTKTVGLHKSGQGQEALVIVQSGIGKQVMDQIRDEMENLIRQQNSETSQAEYAVQKAVNLRISVFVIACVVNLAFLFWIYLRIRRAMNNQYQATLEVERQKELLAVTLSSIGDAVILTDTFSRITYLNPVAEELTGWSLEEAKGERCAEVFNIINETSRIAVESPVEKVLSSGAIVGLANHTLLVRKDGSEIPIDDSGAPIREKNGTVRGVVLVFRDFSIHKENEKSLIHAKEEMEGLSKAKDRFIAVLSHELRTPLTPLLVTLSSWIALGRFPETWRDDVTMMLGNLKLEARLIDDLLDLARIEHGKMVVHLKETDLNQQVKATCEIYQTQLDQKLIRLTINSPDEVYVSADPDRLQQIFWNILGNAIKFTPHGGRIEITVSHEVENQVRVEFTDDGKGMSSETLSRIFENFEQGEQPLVEPRGGLGLGLAISKALIEEHHGTLQARSDGVGKGSSFVITLPRLLSVSSQKSSETIPTPASSTSLARHLRILLLEDHEDTATVMTHALELMEHTVVRTASVAQGLDVIQKQNFDLILSDIGLPDGSGLDFIQQARKMCTTPAIALTGYGRSEEIQQCREAGFDLHLTKPVDFEELKKAISTITLPR